MITEKIIAKEFNALWEEALPFLTPSFVSLFNAAYSEDLTELPNNKFKKIPIGPTIEKHDLVAELAYQLAMVAVENLVSVTAVSEGTKNFELAYERSIQFLSKYESQDKDLLLNVDEMNESFQLAYQYELLFSHLHADRIIFAPIITGSGFLGRCEADLAIDDTLYEVKTVSRNISGKDIKQLILYLALQYSTGDRKWSHAGFFNPRKALYVRFSIDHIIYRTSGGKSTSEVFKDITDFLANRGVEIDTVF